MLFPGEKGIIMSKYYFDKYYEGETHCWCGKVKRRVCSVRLSEDEIKAVTNRYPERDLSYGIRSLIHSHLKV